MSASSLVHYIQHRDELWHRLAPDESPSVQDVRQLALRNRICSGILDELARGQTDCVLEKFSAKEIAIELLRCKMVEMFVALCMKEIAGRARRGIVSIVPMAKGGHALVAQTEA